VLQPFATMFIALIGAWFYLVSTKAAERGPGMMIKYLFSGKNMEPIRLLHGYCDADCVG
jgi:hypothetical protein